MFGFARKTKAELAPASPPVKAPVITPNLIPVHEIFSTSEIPPRTFIDRDRPDMRRLKTALDQAGKVVCMHGESKSGKTMFARNRLCTSHNGYVLIEGSRIASVNDFWQQLGEILKIAIEKERQSKSAEVQSTTVKGDATASFSSGLVGLKASAGMEQATQAMLDAVIRSEPLTSVRSKCLEFLRETKLAVVIDDFHLIEDESVRRDLAFDLKTPAGAQEGKFVIISIPETAFDFVNKDEQLQLRFSILPFPSWCKEELADIATKGFGILGLTVTSKQIGYIVANAILNPLNLQQICVNVCSNANIRSNVDVLVGDSLKREHLASALEDFAQELSFFSQMIDIAAAHAGTTENLTTYKVGDKRLNIYQLALVALSDAGANEDFGVKFSTLRRKIKTRVGDENWNNPHLKTAIEKLTNAEIEIKYRRAISNASEKPLLVDDDKVFVVNPLFRIYLFWCLLPSLGLGNKMPVE